MGFLQDAWTLLGSGGAPALIGGATFSAFELSERLASKEAKFAVTQRLRSLDIRSAAIPPEGSKEIFQRVFGTEHFSAKCLVRSACFSLGSIALLTILAFLHHRRDFIFGGLDPYQMRLAITFVVMWIAWSVIPDYFNLYKTRVVLDILSTRKIRSVAKLSFIVILDFIVGLLIFILSATFIMSLSQIISHFSTASGPFSDIFFQSLVSFIASEFNPSAIMKFLFSDFDLQSILFYAGMVPSFWLWLYGVTLLLTQAILRSERLVKWLRWFLDIDTAPFRSLGAVGAVFTFIVSGIVVGVAAVL